MRLEKRKRLVALRTAQLQNSSANGSELLLLIRKHIRAIIACQYATIKEFSSAAENEARLIRKG